MENINEYYKEQQRSEVMQITPLNISDMFGIMIEAVRMGELNPLDLFLKAKEIEELSKKVKSEVEELAIEEAEKNGAKTFDHGGFTITKTEGRKTIDYSNITVWNEAKEKLKSIEELYKSVALSSVASLDESTGEILERPTIKFSKSSITVKLKK